MHTKVPTGERRMQLKMWVILCLLLNAFKQESAAPTGTDDIENISQYELESIISQLMNPNIEYPFHTSEMRSNQQQNLLRDRQLMDYEQQLTMPDDYDYPEEDKRSISSLASQGYLMMRPGPKRSLATLAKNGQLPTPQPDDLVETGRTYQQQWNSSDKRNLGSLARSGGFMHYGKRNIGTLARDFQLPQNGKRNLATMARLGLLSTMREPKRNMASFARSNSFRSGSGAGKRNLGALRGSPVHGINQKKSNNVMTDAEMLMQPPMYMDYDDSIPNAYVYPNVADYLDLVREEKRFLGRILPPTRATSATNRSRL